MITFFDTMNFFENYTPHTIVVQTSQETFTFPSKGSVRVLENQEKLGEYGGVELRKTNYGEIDGLPEPRNGIKYIVSMVVIMANSKSINPREDLVSPDTGKSCIRDEKGMIKAVTGFTV